MEPPVNAEAIRFIDIDDELGPADKTPTELESIPEMLRRRAAEGDKYAKKMLETLCGCSVKVMNAEVVKPTKAMRKGRRAL